MGQWNGDVSVRESMKKPRLLCSISGGIKCMTATDELVVIGSVEGHVQILRMDNPLSKDVPSEGSHRTMILHRTPTEASYRTTTEGLHRTTIVQRTPVLDRTPTDGSHRATTEGLHRTPTKGLQRTPTDGLHRTLTEGSHRTPVEILHVPPTEGLHRMTSYAQWVATRDWRAHMRASMTSDDRMCNLPRLPSCWKMLPVLPRSPRARTARSERTVFF